MWRPGGVQEVGWAMIAEQQARGQLAAAPSGAGGSGRPVVAVVVGERGGYVSVHGGMVWCTPGWDRSPLKCNVLNASCAAKSDVRSARVRAEG